jgi:hypothetical protein
MKLWSTSTEIDDARHMLVPQFAKMKHENRLCLYRSTARAITVAADNSSLRRMLSPEVADLAVPAALDWVQRAAAPPAAGGEAGGVGSPSWGVAQADG